jgi:hypothetical protein
VTLVNEIADCLTNQMVGNSECRETGVSQNAPAFLAVICRFGGLVDVKMVAPTGELQSVEAHLFGERRKFRERKIGPLAGEESYRSGHSYMQQNSPEHDKYKNTVSIPACRHDSWSPGDHPGSAFFCAKNVQNLGQLFYTRADVGLVSYARKMQTAHERQRA